MYKMSLLHSSNATYSVFLECKLVAPWYASGQQKRDFSAPAEIVTVFYIVRCKSFFGKCSDEYFQKHHRTLQRGRFLVSADIHRKYHLDQDSRNAMFLQI